MTGFEKDWRVLEQVRDVTTPEEMRAELFRLARFDPIVRAVFDSANFTGASAEDRYSVLAYHAIKAKIAAQNQVLEFSSVLVRPRFVEKEN